MKTFEASHLIVFPLTQEAEKKELELCITMMKWIYIIVNFAIENTIINTILLYIRKTYIFINLLK